MRMSSSQARTRKVATNLSVRSDLVRRARELKLSLSHVLETALEAAIRERERESWATRNREAIAEYNAQVAKRGVFSDGWRRF
jgi:antitoxin CcdA